MEAAFALGPASPAARPLLLAGRDRACTRPAPDGGIALPVEGIDRDVMGGDVVPYLGRGPGSQGIDFDQVGIARVRAHDRGLGTFGCLVTANRGDPGGKARSEEHTSELQSLR